MNKALHVFVYVFLALAGAALFFELQLNAKRAELRDRNRMQEDYFVKIAKTIEKEAAKADPVSIEKDDSPVENKIVDAPDMKNLLEDYPSQLETQNGETFNWENKRDDLRQVYVIDPVTGKPQMDGNEPQQRGSPEEKMLETLFGAAKDQQTRLNSTRDQLQKMRDRLKEVTDELNALKPVARQDKVTIDEKNAKIAKLEEEKSALEDQVKKLKAQIEELNGEITSLKDEISTLNDKIEEQKEELAKSQKMIEQLKKLLHDALQQGKPSAGQGTAVTALSVGDKGKVVEFDNTNMFAIVEFTPEAMKEMKGEDLSKPLPALELSVKRPGFNGEAGEFIGRLRLRQEVKGKNFVVCDILGDWEQEKVAKDDVVFAD